MTNEEIEEAAQRCLALGRDEELHPTVADISSEIRALVVQAYEEASQACCERCEKGKQLIAEKGRFLHVESCRLAAPSDKNVYYGGENKDIPLVDAYIDCAASCIHALKDSLVPVELS
jgi:hypothetical protein